MISNFAFYPKQEFAFLVWDPGVKVVRSTSEECLQGSRHVESEVRFSLFTGTPADIYRQFHQSRNQFGYPVLKPKYRILRSRLESWSSGLGHQLPDRGEQSEPVSVPRLSVAVDGGRLRLLAAQGAANRFHETTSFGLYDPNLYPDPRAFIAQFHAKGLKFFQIRTTFIVDGPHSEAGVRNGYFIEENGKPKVFQFDWPESPIYFLDWRKPQAVAWFADLARKWTAFGVDGFKEDVYGYQKYSLGDDKLDPVNAALIREGAYVMGRDSSSRPRPTSTG